MTKTSTKSVQLPTFSGEDKDYTVFWPRFKAYATMKKFRKSLTTATCGLPTTQVGAKDDDLKAIKSNGITIASFMMAFTSAVLMEMVEMSKTVEYPDGIAHMIVDAMSRKYCPTDCIIGVKAKKELMKLKMKKGDPDSYFNKLTALKNKYRNNAATFNKDKMIVSTLAKAPKKYSLV
jgi:hypothetical protein